MTPADLESLFDDANGDLALGELEFAIEKYRRCVAVNPDFFDAWHALEMALMKLGQYDEAVEIGRKTVEMRPNDQLAWSSLSLCCVRAGLIKEAEEAGAKARVLSWGGKIRKE